MQIKFKKRKKVIFMRSYSLTNIWSYWLYYEGSVQKVLYYTKKLKHVSLLSDSGHQTDADVLCPFGVEICVGWEMRIEFHYSTCSYPIGLVQLVDDAVFSMYSWPFCQKLSGCRSMSMGLYMGPQFYSTDWCFCFYARTMLFLLPYLWSITWKSEMLIYSSVPLLFRILGFLDLLCFHIKFKIVLPEELY